MTLNITRPVCHPEYNFIQLKPEILFKQRNSSYSSESTFYFLNKSRSISCGFFMASKVVENWLLAPNLYFASVCWIKQL